MPGSEERVEARNVSLYPQDWKAVDEFADWLGLATSAALRMIVRQWVHDRDADANQPRQRWVNERVPDQV